MSDPKESRRGPPFVEIDGALYLNAAFDLAPRARDPREAISAELGENTRELCVLLRLSRSEEMLVRRYRDDAETEAWARVSVMVAARRSRRRR